MDTSVEILSFDNMCRMCLNKSDNFISISSNKIITMIMACTSVKVSENDELPQHICDYCYPQLEQAFHLKQVTENSDVTLRTVLEYQTNVNDDKTLFDKETINDEEKLDLIKEENTTDETENSVVSFRGILVYKTKEENENTSDDKEPKEENLHEKIDVQFTDEDALLRIQKITDTEHKYAKNEIESSKAVDKTVETDKKNESSDNLLVINKIVLENLNLGDNTSKTERKQSLECEKCEKTFKKANELGLHMKRQHKAEPIPCVQCSMVCYHTLHLKSHMKSHIRGNFTCDICNKVLSNSHKLARHKISHSTERPFPCLQCSSTFKDKWVLFKHIKTVHMNMEKHAECHICRKSFIAYRLKDHMVIHEKDRKTFMCDVCSKVLFSKISLEKHKQFYHMNIVRESKHLCNICGKGTSNAALLKAHLLTHTGEKPFKCDQCTNKYRTKFALKKHVSRVHLMERNHVCAICSDAFADKKTLMNHVRHHTGLGRPYKCDYCEKAFGHKTGLKQHMKTRHTL